MKTTLLLILILATLNVCLGQELSPADKSKEEYKRAGQSELIIGTVLVGGSIPIFLRLASGEVDLDNYPMMIAGGVILLGAGIVILSSSGKNYQKYRSFSAGLDYQKLDIHRMTSKQSKGVPGLKLQISF